MRVRLVRVRRARGVEYTSRAARGRRSRVTRREGFFEVETSKQNLRKTTHSKSSNLLSSSTVPTENLGTRLRLHPIQAVANSTTARQTVLGVTEQWQCASVLLQASQNSVRQYCCKHVARSLQPRRYTQGLERNE